MQIVNLVTNRVARVVGRVENTERFLRVALFQGGASRKAIRLQPGREQPGDATGFITYFGEADCIERIDKDEGAPEYCGHVHLFLQG